LLEKSGRQSHIEDVIFSKYDIIKREIKLNKYWETNKTGKKTTSEFLSVLKSKRFMSATKEPCKP